MQWILPVPQPNHLCVSMFMRCILDSMDALIEIRAAVHPVPAVGWDHKEGFAQTETLLLKLIWIENAVGIGNPRAYGLSLACKVFADPGSTLFSHA